MFTLKRLLIAGVAALPIIGSSKLHAGQLLTNVTFDRALFANLNRGEAPPTFAYSSQFVGTNLPASGTITLVQADGGISSASYNFIDDGSVAEFRITTSYSIPGMDAINESGGTNGQSEIPILFTTTQPLHFTLYGLNSVGLAPDGGVVGGIATSLGINSQAFIYDGQAVNMPGPNYNVEIPIADGDIDAGSICSLLPGMYAGGNGGANGFPNNVSGSSTFDFVLTPSDTSVPQPALSIRDEANGSVALLISGLTNQVYELQATTNLSQSWQSVALLTNTTGSVTYSDTPFTNNPTIFYRAVVENVAP